MTSHLNLRIIDIPLVENKTWRTALVEKMAKDLMSAPGAVDREVVAMRVLHAKGYLMADIIMCIDDARQVAMQDIVAREMAKL